MQRKLQIGNIIISFLLFAAFAFPSAVQFSHALEGHEHTPCTEVTTHMHEDLPECQVCDFHLATFNYEILEYPDFIVYKVPSKRVKTISSGLSNKFYFTNTQLRAPPVDLV